MSATLRRLDSEPADASGPAWIKGGRHGALEVLITPVTPATTGMCEPDKMPWAIHRGARCNVDKTHGWNFWPLMPLPMADARRRVALLPKLGDEQALPRPA